MSDQIEKQQPEIWQTSPKWKRALVSAGIVLFLLVQIAIPASYYLRDEPTSERYAWRMFSSVDLSTWETRVYLTTEEHGRLLQRELDLRAHLQETYVNTLQKAQLDIVAPFMRQLARQPGVREVRFEARGRFPSGKEMPPIRLTLRAGEDQVRKSE